MLRVWWGNQQKLLCTTSVLISPLISGLAPTRLWVAPLFLFEAVFCFPSINNYIVHSASCDALIFIKNFAYVSHYE